MNNDLKKLFSLINQETPPDYLFNKIMAQITAQKKIILMKRLVVLSLGAIVLGAAGLVPIWERLSYDIYTSGTIEFLSLLFTDFKIVLANFDSFVLAFLESTPLTIIAVFLFLFLIFVSILKILAKDLIAASKILMLNRFNHSI